MDMARRDLEDWLWQVDPVLRRFSEEMQPTTKIVARRRAWEPRIDLIEGETFILIKAELAGVETEDIRVTYNIETNILILKGRRKDEARPENAVSTHLLEIPYGDFEREIEIQGMILDVERMQASYQNGMLLIYAPKRDEAPGNRTVIRRTITITEF